MTADERAEAAERERDALRGALHGCGTLVSVLEEVAKRTERHVVDWDIGFSPAQAATLLAALAPRPPEPSGWAEALDLPVGGRGVVE